MGRRVGWTNATWPLAKLSVGPDKLTISIVLLGTYSFAPHEVSAIERYVVIPVLGCLGNPDAVLQGIRDSGFVPSASGSSSPQRRGIAMRWSAILIAS